MDEPWSVMLHMFCQAVAPHLTWEHIHPVWPSPEKVWLEPHSDPLSLHTKSLPGIPHTFIVLNQTNTIYSHQETTCLFLSWCKPAREKSQTQLHLLQLFFSELQIFWWLTLHIWGHLWQDPTPHQDVRSYPKIPIGYFHTSITYVIISSFCVKAFNFTHLDFCRFLFMF